MNKELEEVIQAMDIKVGIEINRASSSPGVQRRPLRKDDI